MAETETQGVRRRWTGVTTNLDAADDLLDHLAGTMRDHNARSVEIWRTVISDLRCAVGAGRVGLPDAESIASVVLSVVSEMVAVR